MTSLARSDFERVVHWWMYDWFGKEASAEDVSDLWRELKDAETEEPVSLVEHDPEWLAALPRTQLRIRQDQFGYHARRLNADVNDLVVQIGAIEKLLDAPGAAQAVSEEEYISVESGLLNFLGMIRDALEDQPEVAA